jgi:Xaa-Pro aminopeptidase
MRERMQRQRARRWWQSATVAAAALVMLAWSVDRWRERQFLALQREAQTLELATGGARGAQERLMRAQAERVPGTQVADRSELLMKMRAAKSQAEIACIREAGRVTATGFAAAMKGMRAGMNEFDLQEAVEHAYRTNGARELAFRTIAGGGFNATVLHYHANDQVLKDGELVVLDSGAKHAGYSADVTRTLPVSGRFTPRQRELYDIVLRAQAAAIAAIKPGVTLAQVDAAGRKVITDAGLGDAFIHGMGHHLGLETHDASPDAPLEVGAVITVEPGVYLPKESIGIRLEDDVAGAIGGEDGEPLAMLGGVELEAEAAVELDRARDVGDVGVRGERVEQGVETLPRRRRHVEDCRLRFRPRDEIDLGAHHEQIRGHERCGVVRGRRIHHPHHKIIP